MIVVNTAGEIVLLNGQAENRLGYRRDELLGQKITTVIPSWFAERLLADGTRSAADSLAQQIGSGIELSALRKDGSEFPIEIMLSPLKSDDGILVTAAIRDITVRKAAEQHLVQTEAKYRGLLEAAPDAMGVVNDAGDIVLVNAQAEKQSRYRRNELVGRKETPMSDLLDSPSDALDVGMESHARALADAMPQIVWTATPDGGLDYYNQHWVTYTGMTVEETHGWGWGPVLHPDDLQNCVDVWTRSVATGEPYEVEYRFKRASDGEYRWHLGRALPYRDPEGRLIKWFGTCTDIHDQKTAQELVERQVAERTAQLTQSEIESRMARDELSAVVNTISDGLITADAQGVIVSANHAAERIFGYMGDLIGRDLKTLRPARYHAAHDVDMARYLADRSRRMLGRGNAEVVGLRQDGGQFPLELSIDTINTVDGVSFIVVARDITVRRQAQQSLLLEKERLRVTLHSIGDGVITTDIHGVVTYLNPVAEHLTGWSSLEAEGQRIGTVFQIVHQKTGYLAPSPVDFVLSTGSVGGLANDTMLLRRNGSQVAIEDSASAIRDSEGTIVGVVLVFHDVSHAREIALQMSHQATHDVLTDLINRREFEHQVLTTLSGEGLQDKGHVLLYLDLDQFKVVNDTSGHIAGDELLRQVASVLRSKLRDHDQLARLGGDEFGVLLRNCPVDAGMRIADSLRQAIGELGFSWNDRPHAIGASIGVVPFMAGGSLTDLLSAADAACYVAKDKGRDRIHLHQVDDADIVQRAAEMDWASRIRAALAEDRFVLFGQQIVPIAAHDTPAHLDQGASKQARLQDGSREVARDPSPHYEVLVRMLDEAGELVPPMAFIPAAERYGLMPAIDRWVLEASLACLSATCDNLHMGTKLSINLSGKTLGDDTFIEFVEAAFRRHRIAYPQVCFEITETAAIANLAQAGQFINWFRQHGCQFALDDFGSGMSSFGYLKHLRVDSIKIDGGFVKDLLDDAVDEAMVVAINNIGHALGLQTVAEFVEHDAILTRLQQLGVDHVQGYGVHVPQRLRSLLGVTSVTPHTS